jgi:hypothetical protein
MGELILAGLQGESQQLSNLGKKSQQLPGLFQ